MKEKFNRKDFMAYMESEFYGMENSMMRGLIDNLIDYGLRHMHTVGAFCGWLVRMIPEITMTEVERYVVPSAEPTSASPIEVPAITREAIKRGIEMGAVKFVVDPDAGSGTVCQIGEHWFYFGGETAEEEDPEVFLANSTRDEVVDCIYETLADFGRLNEFQLEHAYYAHYLKENGAMGGPSRSKDTPSQDSGDDSGERTSLQRQLDITVRVNGEDFEVDVYEPESGEVSQFQFPFSPDEHPEFDTAIGNEIYSWVSLWMEAEEDD